MSPATLPKAIREARTLDALLEACRSLPEDTGPEVTGNLPTFGGEEPRGRTDRTPVWSWDETRLLVGHGFADWRIVPRPRADAPSRTKAARRERGLARLEVWLPEATVERLREVAERRGMKVPALVEALITEAR